MTASTNSAPQLLLSAELKELLQKVLSAGTVQEKISCLEAFPPTKTFLKESDWSQIFPNFTDNEKLIAYSLLALGQTQFFEKGAPDVIKECARALLPVEAFYAEIGGVVGYHAMCLQLLDAEDVEGGRYHPPQAIEISQPTELIRSYIVEGIQRQGELAEIYPIGGAADRLSLQDEKTGEFQIAATLPFCGKTLLGRLIEDHQAREFLYFKLFGKQMRVPVGLMTSDEKRGSERVAAMLEEMCYFGKHPDDFFIFSQPLVPAMNTSGRWCMNQSQQPWLKPGGHGVIWKLARDHGLLDWLKKKNRKKVFVRQINNPIAGVDYGLLAFLGIGLKENKEFGFASCPRNRGLSEGVNVVVEKWGKYSLTNIEYCNHKLSQLNEEVEPFLANTNLLFVGIDTIDALLETCPIPGMLVNAKKVKRREVSGEVVEEEVLRLESTMQNLADALQEEGGVTKSYITSNSRKKTISTIKKEFAFGSSMAQTPEQCYLDLLENSRELLEEYCGFQVPQLRDSTSFFEWGPSFIFLYHPALGPLYEVICQKLVKGRLAMGSELKLEIADFFAENLDIDGSLHVSTPAVMGHFDEKGTLIYSNRTGKCVLKNVRIRNSGINREASRSFWKEEVVHREKCEIIIEEGGEFYAEDLVLRGSVRIRVQSGVKVTAQAVDGQLHYKLEVLDKSSWTSSYTLGAENEIVLKMR